MKTRGGEIRFSFHLRIFHYGENSVPASFNSLRRLFRLIFPAIALLAGCASPDVTNPEPSLLPGDPNAPSQVTPTEALTIAEQYTHHAWRPFARNLHHGKDRAGIRVDTPDVGYRPASGRNGWWIPGEMNQGIPYKWGGFDDLASFDRAIAKGRPAGDVATPAKRKANNAAVSSVAAGVDCSGLISRCLKLPRVHDSAELPTICEPIEPHDLRPGDLLNVPNRHVMLFAGWAKPDKSWMYFYETGGVPDWKPGLKESPLDAILALGFQPLRYRGMAREAKPSGKQVLTRAVLAKAISIPNPTIGDP